MAIQAVLICSITYVTIDLFTLENRYNNQANLTLHGWHDNDLISLGFYLLKNHDFLVCRYFLCLIICFDFFKQISNRIKDEISVWGLKCGTIIRQLNCESPVNVSLLTLCRLHTHQQRAISVNTFLRQVLLSSAKWLSMGVSWVELNFCPSCMRDIYLSIILRMFWYFLSMLIRIYTTVCTPQFIF